MGFWGKLFGREYDTTVTDFQASALTASARPFRMAIEDVFSITGRGTVATGTITAGALAVGDVVQVHRADGARVDAKVIGIEAFRKQLQSAAAGDEMVGVLLESVTKHDLNRGDTLEA